PDIDYSALGHAGCTRCRDLVVAAQRTVQPAGLDIPADRDSWAGWHFRSVVAFLLLGSNRAGAGVDYCRQRLAHVAADRDHRVGRPDWYSRGTFRTGGD